MGGGFVASMNDDGEDVPLFADGKPMRTAPLWGLPKVTTYLHDGGATTLEAAILAHDGQGKKARNRFAGLSGANKQFLYAFSSSLWRSGAGARVRGR